MHKNFQILFSDCSERFEIKNAQMFTEGGLIRFAVFEGDKLKETVFFPLCNVHRIKVIHK
jgi:hypothetical protein